MPHGSLLPVCRFLFDTVMAGEDFHARRVFMKCGLCRIFDRVHFISVDRRTWLPSSTFSVRARNDNRCCVCRHRMCELCSEWRIDTFANGKTGALVHFRHFIEKIFLAIFIKSFSPVQFFWLVSKWYFSLFSAARRIHFISIIAMAFFFSLLLPPPPSLFSHWFMSEMQKIIFLFAFWGGTVYVRQTKKLRGKIMAAHWTHYTLFRPAWLSCFEICNKLMLLEIFSVSTYIHFGRTEQTTRKKNEIKTDWHWVEMGLCCARSKRHKSLEPNTKMGNK